MLSILVPIYNFDIRALTNALRQQAQQLDIAWEIRCIDDGSDSSWKIKNRELTGLEGVYYKELPQNLGRSRIRNLLADEARFDYLLLMDCDSMPPDGEFLQRYASLLQPDTLLYGGRAYQALPPQDPELFFHWHYGRQREALPAASRRLKPYQSFMTNNFLIPKAIFQEIRFDERLLRYGHEDTLFGMELEARKVSIVHLDNPLIHLGLETAAVFLAKTRQGIKNLAFLEQTGNYRIDTRLLRFYRKTLYLGLATPICLSLKLARPLLLRQLHSPQPSLHLFDLYKLSFLLEELHHC